MYVRTLTDTLRREIQRRPVVSSVTPPDNTTPVATIEIPCEWELAPPEPVIEIEAAIYMTLSELNLRAPVAAMRLESRFGGGRWREMRLPERREAWAKANGTVDWPQPCDVIPRCYDVLLSDHPAYDELKAAYPAHDADKFIRRPHGFIDWTFVELVAFLGLLPAVARVDAYAKTPRAHGCRLLEDYRVWAINATFEGF